MHKWGEMLPGHKNAGLILPTLLGFDSYGLYIYKRNGIVVDYCVWLVQKHVIRPSACVQFCWGLVSTA